MNYLTLTKQEIKELIEIRLAYFIGYLIVMTILFLGYLEVIRYFTPRILHTEILTVTGLFAVCALGYLVFQNKEYLQEIIQKRKRVYKGVLGIKTSSHSEYSFHMDGYVFTVDQTDFNKFSEGDFVEFHISPSTKHLFKVMKAE